MTTDHIKMLQATVDKSRATIHDNGTVSIGKPRHKEWQGLSDDDIWNIANFLGKNKQRDYPVMFAKTIEQALKEKQNE